ncbi:unnamed protein product [Urochloa humidicola]
MGWEEQKEAAARSAKKAGDKAYGIEDYKAAADHYKHGSSLDPSDITFLMKLAKAMLGLKEDMECLRYCDMLIKEANTRGGTDMEEQIKEAELLKESARANLATCATDCEPVIAVLEQYSSERTNGKLDQTKRMRKMFVKQEQLNRKADKLRGEGQKLLDDGNYEGAEKLFTKAIQINPWDHESFSYRANCHFIQDKFAEASEDADRCIRLNPKFEDGYICKAMAQFKMRNVVDVLSTVADWLDHNPGNPDIPGLLRSFTLAVPSQIAESNRDASAESSSQTEYEDEVEQLRSQYHQLKKKLHAANEHANLKRQLEEYEKRCEKLGKYFICPLSQGVMEYPVIAADRRTYEAVEIMKSFKYSSKSPITRNVLEHQKLIPDDRMRSAIEKWRELNNLGCELKTNLWNICPALFDSPHTSPLH